MRTRHRSETGGLIPRYGLTEGLSMDQMGRIVRAAVEAYAESIPDPMPAALRERLDLPELKEAVRGLHLPKTLDEYEKSRRRLIFDDLFEFQLGLALRRRSWKTARGRPCLADDGQDRLADSTLVSLRFHRGTKQGGTRNQRRSGVRPRDAPPAAGRRGSREDGCCRLCDPRHGCRRIPGGHHGADRSVGQPTLGHDRLGPGAQPRQKTSADGRPRGARAAGGAD